MTITCPSSSPSHYASTPYILFSLTDVHSLIDIIHFLSLLHLFDFLADRGEFCRGGSNVRGLVEEV